MNRVIGLLRDALKRSMGEATFCQLKQEFERRTETGEFIAVERKRNSPARAFTTAEMIRLERDTIQQMRAGQNQYGPVVRPDNLELEPLNRGTVK